MRAAPGSQLLLHADEGAHRRRLQEFMVRAGVEGGRVRFAGKVSLKDYFAHYQGIDVALDTWPYGGGTTTCDALWMGVPVVTLAGQRAVGRGGVSILTNAGLRELVAQTEAEYVGMALELARDFDRLGKLRATLRQRMEQSPLMDAAGFSRHIEAAYRRMWSDWCATGRREFCSDSVAAGRSWRQG